MTNLMIKANKNKIQFNPFQLTGNLYPLKDNGYGKMIEDKTAVPVVKTYTNPVRISFEKKAIQKMDTTGSPITVEKRIYFMISDNETKVDLRLEFLYHETKLKVTQVKKLRKYGLNELIGYEYELKNITEDVYYAS